MKTSDSTQTDFLSAIMSLIIFQIFGVFSILGWLYQYNFGEITSGTDQNEFARLHFEKVTVTYNSTPKLFEMALRRADEIIAEFNQFCTIYTFTESRGLCCAWSQLSKGLGDNRQVTTPLNLARWIQLAPTMISAQSTTINEEQDWIVQITADDCGESLGKKRKRKSQQKKSTSDLVALIDGRLKRFADAANDYPGDWDDLDRLAISRLPDYHQQIYPSAEATSCLPVCDTIDEAVSTLRNAFADKTVHYQRLEAKDAEYLSAADDLFIPQLVSGVKKCIGIDLHSQLYAHQTQAISGVLREDKNVVVATSTSSGKSLIFHLPIIQTIIESSAPVCALYIFPTVFTDEHLHPISLIIL
jgi:hypothetical protein